MPRKRRAAKARREQRELTPTMAAILIYGWAGPPWPEDEDGWDVFLASENDFKQAWQTNRVALTKEARRRGIAEPYGLRYDKEQ